MAGIGDQFVAIEQVGKQVLAEGDGLVGLEFVHAGLEPGGLWRFHNKRGHLFVEPVGVQVKPAELGLLEGKGEGVELFLGTQPDKPAGTQVNARVEMCFVLGPSGGKHAIGTDHQVVFVGVDIGIGNLLLPQHLDAQFSGAALKDLQQLQTGDAAKTVTARSDLAAFEVDIDIVPMVEIGLNFIDDLFIGIPKTIHGLVGENDAPTKGVVGGVAVNHGNVV